MRERQQVVSLAAKRETSLLRFYVSREWLNKFNTFAEPGPITNHTFLCPHGGEGAFCVPRVWDGRAEPPPVPPRAFLRRHPAQQVPLHRRPGGDPAAGRLGVPVQQVRCCGQPLPGGRPAPSRAAEEDREGAATVPSAPAADGTEAVAGASLASVSELEKTHGVGGTQVDAHRAQVQKTGLSESARIGPSHVLGVLAAGGLASISPRPHVWLRWPWACAAWSLPRSSPSRREHVALLLRDCLGPGHSTAGQAGRAAGRGGQTAGEGEAKELRPPWPLAGLALLCPLEGQAQSRWAGQNPRVRCTPNPMGPTCRRTCSLPLTSSLGSGRVGSRPPSRPVARRGSESVSLSIGR